MADPSFYDAGPLRQIATNLFYGWGYNFYRIENQLRSDDQLIRAKAGWLLGLAQAGVDAAESEFRREFLPPPSRAKPYPDPDAIRSAQELERLSKAIGSLIGRLHALPVPENDRMTQRYRSEAATLEALGECDSQLVGQCEVLRSLVQNQSANGLIENKQVLHEGLSAIEKTIIRRQAILM